MANLPEESTFDAGVYRIETTDLVRGGADGVTNTPLKNLTNRTRWLFDQITALVSGKSNTGHTHVQGDVGGLTAALAGKAPVAHAHPISDVTGLGAALDGKAAAGHTHSRMRMTGYVGASPGTALPSGVETEVLLATYPGLGGGLFLFANIGLQNALTTARQGSIKLYIDGSLSNEAAFVVPAAPSGSTLAVQYTTCTPGGAVAGDRVVRITITPQGGALVLASAYEAVFEFPSA